MNNLNTKERILLEAESLIQSQGYNAFSFKDIAATIDIKTSSIHYYFPSKEDLGVEVIKWHSDKINIVLTEISNNKKLSIEKKLLLFHDAILLLTVKAENKMCLGGMFASDLHSLPCKIQQQVKIFFNTLLHWLEEILLENRFSKKRASSLAKQIIAFVEGSLLLARLYGDVSFLDGARHFIKQSIK